MGSPGLPPDPLPPLPDPCYGDRPGPYSASPMRDVCGTRINPDAIGFYKRREYMRDPRAWQKTCAHPELEAWLGDVGGLDPRARISQPPLEDWPLTAVMARIDARPGGMPFELPEMTYLVDYASFHSDPHSLPNDPRVHDMKERLFPERSSLILSFFNNHMLKLGLWPQPDFWYQEWLDQFTAVLLPDFSAFSDDPVPQSLLGERMHQIFGEDGSLAGRTVIPSIAWMSEDSLRRQVELWTSMYPKVNTIRLDCYGYNVDRTGWTWRWLFAIEKYCKGMDHIRWIVSGITAGWAIRELNDIFPKRNYALVAPVTTFIAAQRRSTDREWSAREFRRRIGQLEDFRAGREVAERKPRPAVWPKFSDVKKTRSKS